MHSISQDSNVADQHVHDGRAIMNYAGSILLGLPVVFLCRFGHSHNKLGFGFCIRNPVILVGLRQLQLEQPVLVCHIGILDKVVTKEQSIPVLEVGFNHVDMVCSLSLCAALDEPCVEGGRVVSQVGRQK